MTTTSGLAAAAAAGGLALLLVTEWLARTCDDDPARGWHLAAAASVGLAALPATAAALLQLAPGARVWLGVIGVCVVPAVLRAARVHGPGGGALRQLRAASLSLGAGLGLAFGLPVLVAAASGSGPVETPATAVYEADARVVTRPLPVCRDAAASVRELLDRGAHPRLDPDGGALWLDARSARGLRQVHRLDLATGRIRCWTCGEPGNNRRPHPGAAALVFETDRHADWRDPANTELHLLRIRGAGPEEPSRRLTRAPGPDGHPLMAPASGRVVWTRREGGHAVVWAPIRSAHGALGLGGATALARGGAAWVAAAAWSADARSLALVSGNPFAPLRGSRLDPATGARSALGDDLVAGGVAFSADGGALVVAGTLRGSSAGLLPAALGSLLAPAAGRLAREGALHRETRLRVGETGTNPIAHARDGGARTGVALRPLPLPEVEAWGAPTGVAMSADGTTVYLAQRSGDGARERLVEIRRDCR